MSARAPRLSIIIPALNEAKSIERTLLPLQPLRSFGSAELILADGGSIDNTTTIARPMVDTIVSAAAGRASQMNRGAEEASGEVLLFLHADTRLRPSDAERALHAVIAKPGWGRFDVRLSGKQWLFRIIERLMNWRSCLTGIATGDQGIFVSRTLFEQVGGYPQQPLMEDIVLSSKLRHHSRPRCIHTPITTSSRRWEHYGILRTVWLMWRMRLAYFLGTPAEELAERYRRSNPE